MFLELSILSCWPCIFR